MTAFRGQNCKLGAIHLRLVSEDGEFRPKPLTVKTRSIGGMKTFLFSGEGFVVDLTGPGKFLIQTRSQDQFLSWLIPKLPKSSNISTSSS